MTKADLVERVAGKTGLSKSDIAVVVDEGTGNWIFRR